MRGGVDCDVHMKVFPCPSEPGQSPVCQENSRFVVYPEGDNGLKDYHNAQYNSSDCHNHSYGNPSVACPSRASDYAEGGCDVVHPQGPPWG